MDNLDYVKGLVFLYRAPSVCGILHLNRAGGCPLSEETSRRFWVFAGRACRGLAQGISSVLFWKCFGLFPTFSSLRKAFEGYPGPPALCSTPRKSSWNCLASLILLGHVLKYGACTGRRLQELSSWLGTRLLHRWPSQILCSNSSPQCNHPRARHATCPCISMWKIEELQSRICFSASDLLVNPDLPHAQTFS